MATLTRVRFVEWDLVEAFGSPHDAAVRLKAQEALGYVPWPFTGYGDIDHAGVLAHCPRCGAAGSLRFVGPGETWTYNGNADTPTLSPSVFMPKDDHGFCGFHCFVRDGQIIDAGTPAHGGTA